MDGRIDRWMGGPTNEETDKQADKWMGAWRRMYGLPGLPPSRSWPSGVLVSC